MSFGIGGWLAELDAKRYTNSCALVVWPGWLAKVACLKQHHCSYNGVFAIHEMGTADRFRGSIHGTSREKVMI